MKLLKIVFIILVLVTAGELGFYFYIRKGNQTQNIKNQDATPIQITPINYMGLGEDQDNPGLLIKQSTINYLKNDFIPSLEKIKSGIYSKIYIVEEQVGVVGQVYFDSFPIWIRINDEKGNEIATYHITQSRIDKQKFKKEIGGVNSDISYKEINVGDKINVLTYINLITYTDSYQDYIILD